VGQEEIKVSDEIKFANQFPWNEESVLDLPGGHSIITKSKVEEDVRSQNQRDSHIKRILSNIAGFEDGVRDLTQGT
jgi:hypothetical protein